ncbi:MAG: hypothetical protein WCI74_07435 [Actinomycetes bacterium]
MSGSLKNPDGIVGGPVLLLLITETGIVNLRTRLSRAETIDYLEQVLDNAKADPGFVKRQP